MLIVPRWILFFIQKWEMKACEFRGESGANKSGVINPRKGAFFEFLYILLLKFLVGDVAKK